MKTSNAMVMLIVAGSLLSATSSSKQPVSNPLAQTLSVGKDQNYSYSDDDGNYIHLLGVATIDSEQIVCWDMNGKRSQQLEDRMMTYSAMFMVDFRIPMKTKSRFLIVDTRRNITDYACSMDGIEQVAKHISLSKSSLPNMFEIQTPRDVQQANLNVNISTWTNERVLLPIKTGGQTYIGKSLLEFVKVEPFKGNVNELPYASTSNLTKWWSISVADTNGAENPGNLAYLDNIVVLDKNKRPIDYVDKKGHPASIITALKNDGVDMGLMPSTEIVGKLANYWLVAARFNWTDKNIAKINLNVAPENVAYIVLQWRKSTVSQVVKFKDIPLEPKD